MNKKRSDLFRAKVTSVSKELCTWCEKAFTVKPPEVYAIKNRQFPQYVCDECAKKEQKP